MNKSEHLFCRIDPDDKRRVEMYAKKSGMDLSDYVRRVVLKGIIFKTEEVTELPASPEAELTEREKEALAEIEKARRLSEGEVPKAPRRNRKIA